MSEDPFEKAGKIRRGELDDEMPSFDELSGWIQRVPMTWLPALLERTVHACVMKNVFREGKLVPYVERCEQMAIEYKKDPSAFVLREE